MLDADLTTFLTPLVTYHDKCPVCAFPTIKVDLPVLYGRKICVQCLIDQIDPAHPDIVANLEYDLDDALSHLEAREGDYAKLEAEAEELQGIVTDLEVELGDGQRLVKAATDECDAFRRKFETFDDDKTALQNESARLRLDIQQLKGRMEKHGQR